MVRCVLVHPDSEQLSRLAGALRAQGHEPACSQQPDRVAALLEAHSGELVVGRLSLAEWMELGASLNREVGSLALVTELELADGPELPTDDICLDSASSAELGTRLARLARASDPRRSLIEGRLRESEARYRQLVQDSPDPIVIVVDGELRYVNHAAVELSGAESAEQLEGRSFKDFFEPERHDELVHLVETSMDGQQPRPTEQRLLRVDGETRRIELLGAPVPYRGRGALQVVARDVTDRRDTEGKMRRIESRLQHTQKLESLGVLAGGVAHDFNNLLAAIIGNVEQARRKAHDAEALRAALDRVDIATQRASDLTAQMLAYSGKGKLASRRVDLSSLVEDLADLLGSVLAKSTALHRKIDARIPPVKGDPTQLGQVVMNLITNASDALEGRPGQVFVSTRYEHVEASVLQHAYIDQNLPEARYVCLEVRDTGAGMSEETRARIFDPFFTTKSTGRGLGLAATLGIIRGHGGTILLDSTPGVGTCFRIYLPAAAPRRPPAPDAPSDPDTATHSGTVLIVDDEPLVLDVTRTQLEDLGFSVLSADGGEASIECYDANANSIDLVILDMTMPDLNGLEVLARLRALNPAVKVVMTSGYAEDEIDDLADAGISGFLRKPYTQSRLEQRVLDALAPTSSQK